MTSLNERLLQAHERGDCAALVELYEKAAEQATAQAATCFYLTHAYVYALEIGSAEAPGLRERLIALGVESPLHSETTRPR